MRQKKSLINRAVPLSRQPELSHHAHGESWRANGNKKEALKILKPAKKQLSETHYRVLEALVDFLELAGRIDEEGAGVRRRAACRHVAQACAGLAFGLADWPRQGTHLPSGGRQVLMQMPPVLNRSLGELLRLFGQVMYDLKNETAHAKLDLALRSHPEGTLYFVHGTTLFGHGHFRQAALQFHTASTTPSIARLRRSALMMAAVSEAQVAWTRRTRSPIRRCSTTV